MSATFSDKPRPHNRACDAQHLAHSRTSTRPFVANHQDVARADPRLHHRGHRGLFGIEHARRPALLRAIDAGDLDHAAFRRNDPRRITSPPLFLIGLFSARITS